MRAKSSSVVGRSANRTSSPARYCWSDWPRCSARCWSAAWTSSGSSLPSTFGMLAFCYRPGDRSQQAGPACDWSITADDTHHVGRVNPSTVPSTPWVPVRSAGHGEGERVCDQDSMWTRRSSVVAPTTSHCWWTSRPSRASHPGSSTKRRSGPPDRIRRATTTPGRGLPADHAQHGPVSCLADARTSLSWLDVFARGSRARCRLPAPPRPRPDAGMRR